MPMPRQDDASRVMPVAWYLIICPNLYVSEDRNRTKEIEPIFIE